MSWQRGAAIAIGGLFLAGCGPAATPVAVVPPAGSPTPVSSPIASPSANPSPEPTPTTQVASVTCSGGPGTSMAVVSGGLLYDVANPVEPRLICRAQNTYLQLVAGNSIVYTKAAAG